MGLQRADARSGAGGIQLHLVADAQAVAAERSGDHGSRTFDGEHAVDEQARTGVFGWTSGGEHGVERGGKILDALAGLRRHRYDRRVGEHGPGQTFAHLVLGESERLGVDQIAFRERHDTASYAEDVQDLQVLLGLRLPSLVCGHDEEHQPNGADAGEHVCDEPLVARHIDEPNLATGRQRAPRVSQIDRQPAPFLFRPAVGIDTGQTNDQRRLAVIHVAGRRHDPELARHADSVLVDVVALAGVLDGAGQVGQLIRQHCPHVEDDRVRLYPTEHRRGARP